MISFLQCIIFEPISYSEFILDNFIHFENLYFLKIVGPNFVVIRGHNYDKGQIPLIGDKW